MPGPDLSEFRALTPSKLGPCAVGTAHAALAAGERAKLDAALARPRVEIPNTAIRKWLDQRGHRVSINAITAHRHQSCACTRADD